MKKLFQFIERRFSRRYSVQIPAAFSILLRRSSLELTGNHPGKIISLGKKGCCLVVNQLHFEGFYIMKCLEMADDHLIKIKATNKKGKQIVFLGTIRYINSGFEDRKRWFFMGVEWLSSISIKDFIRD